MRQRPRVLPLASTLLTFFAALPAASAADDRTPSGVAPAPAAKTEDAPLSTVGTGLAPAPEPPAAPKTTPPTPPEHPSDPPKATDGPPKFEFWTLIQPQFIDTLYNSAASPNVDATTGQLPPGINANDVIARSDGGTTNAMGFRMRRTRLAFIVNPVKEASAKLDVELLPFGTNGVFWRDAYVTGHANWSPNVKSDFHAGSFKVPFNHEEIESSRVRPFIERSIGTRVFFPSDRDLGIWIETKIFKKLRLDLAVVNGVMQGEKAYTLMPDLNRTKDFTAHINYDFGPFDVGASFYGGAGQLVDAKGLRTKSYGRWAAHGEAGLHHTFIKALGPTKIYAAATVAKNMDRGTIFAFGPPSIPSNISSDADVQKTGLAFFGRFEQRLSPRFIAGFRYDYYTPQLTEAQNAYQGFTPMFGIFLIEQLRWSAEYTYVHDDAHAPGAKPAGHQLQIITTYLHANFEL